MAFTKRKGTDSARVEGQGKKRRKHGGVGPLPDTGFLRLRQIIGDAQAVPPVPALLPIGRSSFWAGIQNGIYPQGIKLGPRTTVWRVQDIRAILNQGVGRGEQP
jgi:predicted DNA-binding transcriptional regulator AlpA